MGSLAKLMRRWRLLTESIFQTFCSLPRSLPLLLLSCWLKGNSSRCIPPSLSYSLYILINPRGGLCLDCAQFVFMGGEPVEKGDQEYIEREEERERE